MSRVLENEYLFINNAIARLQKALAEDQPSTVIRLPGAENLEVIEGKQNMKTLLNRYQRRIGEIEPEYHRQQPYERYKRLAGEAEARAVQARRDLTPEQRRATIPLADYDVPLSELTVRR